MHQSLLSFYHRSPTTALLSFSSVTPSLFASSLFSSIYSTNRLFHSSSFSMSSSRQYDYDFAVIGGGSGGLAASKEAAKLLKQSNPSAKVACFDFVQPTQHGTKWGLGGTCVNVGCVPKKLFHHAGLLGKSAKEDASQFGWKGTEGISHNWNELVTVVTNYIRSLNFSYRTSLRSAGVDYFDSYAHFVDAHTLAYKNNTKSGQITVDKVLIATGGRPDFGGIPGGEVAISSDDIFWSKKAPGKTLVIGSGYIGVECAGFLHHLGYDTTLMVRGQFMRKFDLQAAQQIGELMEREGMKFLLPAQPVSMKKINRKAPPAGLTPDANGLIHLPSDDKSIQRLLYPSGAIEIRSFTPGVRSKWEIPDGAIEVSYIINNDPSKKIHTEIFDSVLIATGRAAAVQDLHLDKIGVKLYRNKVLVDKSEQTTVNNIYCVGDAAIGVPEHGKDDNYLKNHANDRPELTPVAIQAGILLAKRLFGGSNELMQYHLIPSTVFSSPVEYGFIGYSEEEARLLYGSDNIEVYYSRFGNLEISPTHAEPVKNRSYAFTKDNLWAYQYTKQKKLEWNEVSIIEGNPVYIYEEKSASGEEPKKGYITARSKDDKGNYLYDIELDGGMVITNIDRSRIILQEEALASQDELFTKAICLAKLIVDKKNNEKVIGFHFIGPNAGEVTQGFSLGMSLGATKTDFDRMIGIHPTAAEEFAVLSIQQSSGISPLKKAGCGGGTCG